MLETWGGDGFDTITQEELDRVGLDTCIKYCKDYCWRHGFGCCQNCVLVETARSTDNQIEDRLVSLDTIIGVLDNMQIGEHDNVITFYRKARQAISEIQPYDEAIYSAIKEEIEEEAEHAYVDFEWYKVEYLGQSWEDVSDSLPYDDFRYGMKRAVEIINKHIKKGVIRNGRGL